MQGYIGLDHFYHPHAKKSGSLSKGRTHYLTQELAKSNQLESLQWKVIPALLSTYSMLAIILGA